MPPERELKILGSDLAGKDILEIACGCGQSAVHLAEQGARVTGVDFSSAQLVQIGAPKTDVPRIAELIRKGGKASAQIGKFGIGILSCFGIADQIEVRTKTEESEGIAFRIPSINDEIAAI